MLATRRVIAAAQRRAIAPMGVRCMATVSDAPLDKKVAQNNWEKGNVGLPRAATLLWARTATFEALGYGCRASLAP